MKFNYLALSFWTVLSLRATKPTLIARVYNYAGVSATVMRRAELEAERVLKAGVAVQWITCDQPREGHLEQYPAEAVIPTKSTDFVIRILPRAMDRAFYKKDVFGYAVVDAGRPLVHAYVLYDNLQERVRTTTDRISEFRFLAHVLAHEMAHLLFGNDRHSASGMMMANWTAKEFRLIERGTLNFSGDDIRALRAGIREQFGWPASSVVENATPIEWSKK
jgi:hypothetical protein